MKSKSFSPRVCNSCISSAWSVTFQTSYSRLIFSSPFLPLNSTFFSNFSKITRSNLLEKIISNKYVELLQNSTLPITILYSQCSWEKSVAWMTLSDLIYMWSCAVKVPLWRYGVMIPGLRCCSNKKKIREQRKKSTHETENRVGLSYSWSAACFFRCHFQ